MIPNFRVWDIKNKCHYDMDYIDDLYIQNQSIYSRECVSGEEDSFLNVSNKYIVEMGSGVFNNGIEIFEGDLVNVRDSLGQIRVAEVKFRDGYFYTTCIVRYRWGESPCENQLKSYSKVVGHIHE